MQRNVKNNQTSIQIEIASIENKPIATGMFAKVYQGKASNGTPVVVKHAEGWETSSRKLMGDIKCLRTEIHILEKLTQHDGLEQESGCQYVIKYYGHHFSEEKTPQCQFVSGQLILEYADAGNLRQWIKNSAIDPLIAYGLMGQLASGLTYIHSKEIVHSDVKAENCVLLRDITSAVGYIIKFIDFGLSIDMERKKNKPSTSISYLNGTILYMAPEILSGEQQTYSSDMYSLSLLFWEMITAKQAYDEFKIKNPEELYTLVVENDKKNTIPSDCPKKIAHLITWGFTTDPQKRLTAPQMKEELSTDLNTISARLSPYCPT